MWKNTKKAIALAGYSSDTIAEYFRRQGAQVGEDCDISVDYFGPEPGLVSIGNHVFIAQGVIFLTHEGGVWILRNKIPGIRIFGPVVIEDNCIIGTNAVLGPDIRIGRNSIVAPGSVVISDVPPDSIVGGMPAKPISSVSNFEEKCSDKWNEQKMPGLNVEGDETWWLYKKNKKDLIKHLEKLFASQNKTEEAGNKT